MKRIYLLCVIGLIANSAARADDSLYTRDVTKFSCTQVPSHPGYPAASLVVEKKGSLFDISFSEDVNQAVPEIFYRNLDCIFFKSNPFLFLCKKDEGNINFYSQIDTTTTIRLPKYPPEVITSLHLSGSQSGSHPEVPPVAVWETYFDMIEESIECSIER